MDPLSDADFVRIISEVHAKPSAKVTLVRGDAEALVNEVVRLRGIIYDAKEIRVEQWRWVNRLEALLRGEGGTKG